MSDERETTAPQDRPDRDKDDGGLIPDADAGRTDAGDVSEDEGNEGHEEYKTP
jgi:hypothetical protein